MATPNSAADHQLMVAATRGDVAEILQLIPLARPTAKDSDNYTALHMAAEEGHVRVVETLLLHGWAVHARCSIGITALHLAADGGHVDVARCLLGSGASPAAINDEGSTPLHVAAANGQTAVMDLLLQSGASISALDSNGKAPINWACDNSHTAAVAALLKAGAAADSVCSESEGTVLHGAAAWGELSVLCVLLDAGASINAQGSDGSTPLAAACSYGYELVVTELLRCGADPSRRSNEGCVALHAAVQGNHVGVVRLLLGVPEVVADIDAASHSGETPLCWACTEGCGEIVSLLLAKGADVHAVTAAGLTPLRAAVGGEHLEVVRILLEAGADPCVAGPDGITALHDAATCGGLPILQTLLAAAAAGQGRAAINTYTAGLTALHLAVEKDHTSCVEVLLAAGADADKVYGAEARDDEGSSLAGATALHRAVELGRVAAVPLLATPHNLRHMWVGGTPLQMALVADREDMAQALVAAGSSAGLPYMHVSTALMMAARSRSAAILALLPVMVRSECEAYQQLVKGKEQQQEGVQQQQQQQEEEEEGGQEGLPAVLATVAEGMCGLLIATSFAGRGGVPEQRIGAACFYAVMEVLGPTAAGDLLQRVLELRRGDRELTICRMFVLQLVHVLHIGWLEAVDPVMQLRWRWASRLQRLTKQQQQQEGSASTTAGAQQQRVLAGAAELMAQVEAAAGAGDWQLFVQLLEQLTGVQPTLASALLCAVVEEQNRGHSTGVPGLCEALLQAWWEARQHAEGRAAQEAAAAVVSAVMAWRGCQLQPFPVGASEPLPQAVEQRAAGGAATVGAAACAVDAAAQAEQQQVVAAAAAATAGRTPHACGMCARLRALAECWRLCCWAPQWLMVAGMLGWW